jgi:hypothetical protein
MDIAKILYLTKKRRKPLCTIVKNKMTNNREIRTYPSIAAGRLDEKKDNQTKNIIK